MESVQEVFKANLEKIKERMRREESGEEEVIKEPTLEELTIRGREIEDQGTEWVWPARVPVGHVTALFGPRGSGKSFVALDIAARVTAGLPWPDGPETSRAPGSVLLVTPEDDFSTMVGPRLRKAGADMDKVFVVRYPHMKVKSRKQFHEEEIDRWELIADKVPDLRLIVVDPFALLMGTAVDRRSSELADILCRLSEVASKRKLAVLLVNGTDKVSAGKFWANGMDALPHIRAAARTVWELETDHGNRRRRLLVPTQVTLTDDPGGLTFSIDPATLRIVWNPEPVATEANGPPASRREVSGVARAATWLRGFLAHGPRTAGEVYREGGIADHSQNALYRAKGKLDVLSHKSNECDGAWLWELPATAFDSQVEFEDLKMTGRDVRARKGRGGSKSRNPLEDSKMTDTETDVRHGRGPSDAELARRLKALGDPAESPRDQVPEKPAHIREREAMMREAGMMNPVIWDGSDRPKVPKLPDARPSQGVGPRPPTQEGSTGMGPESAATGIPDAPV